ncbi:hypothetical protein J4N02_11130 [Propioniciclava sp. MC1595]|uniref:hypothetical protein n=1 Tax=Propioniciclava sp. MC1595 TaxID=2760308 RepID=UPI0016626232|nr:hypothetical protein [Propioniciclava sp. MC1595]MBB1496441.1 hypothetical protein [Propioniciclava sp. MC1595]QTE25095.1 hypothetical protein J4N02_11130 [Propioniciclava sp. MC1595]
MLLLDPTLAPDPRGLRLVGARIAGTLDLQGVSLDYPVELEQCFFTHQPDLRRATMPALSFAGSYLPGLDVQGLRITHGSLNLSDIKASGGVDASGANINGQLEMTGARVESATGVALSMDGTRILGGLSLGRLRTSGQLRAPGAVIGLQLLMSGANLSSDDGFAMILDGARIDGNVVLDEGFRATGELRAIGATISGTVEMSGACLRNDSGVALNLEGARISGSAFLKDGFTASGALRLIGAVIDGPLVMAGATLKDEGGQALHLDRVRIGGGLFLNDGFTATGEVRALGAHIGGQVLMAGACLDNGSNPALSVDGARIAESVLLNDGFTYSGEVRAAGAEIGGSLVMTGARSMDNAQGILNLEAVRIGRELTLMRVELSAVYAPHASIGGSVRLDSATLDRKQMRMILNGVGMDWASKPVLEISNARIGGNLMLDGLETNGPISALGIKIDGQLSARGATFDYLGEETLALDRAVIGGSCFLDAGFSCASQVRAPGAEIKGRIYLRGGSLGGNGDWPLNLEGANIGGLVLDSASLSGGMNVTQAQVGVLESHGSPPMELTAAGWRINELGGSLTSVAVMKTWLSSVNSTEFSIQPWHEIASVFERHGRPSDAKRLRFHAATITTNKSPLWARMARRTYGMFAGYGYYPLLAGVWLIGAAIVASALTYCFGPSTLNPWLYGTAVVIPSAAAVIPSTWTVVEPLWLAWCLIVLKGFGWLQTGILLAGLTGLLKKQ